MLNSNAPNLFAINLPGLASILFIFLFMISSGCRPETPPVGELASTVSSAAESRSKIKTAPARRQNFPLRRIGAGALQSRRRADIKTRIGGQILEMPLQPGIAFMLASEYFA